MLLRHIIKTTKEGQTLSAEKSAAEMLGAVTIALAFTTPLRQPQWRGAAPSVSMKEAPLVPYRFPGSEVPQWINVYNRMYRERIIFIGKVCLCGSGAWWGVVGRGGAWCGVVRRGAAWWGVVRRSLARAAVWALRTGRAVSRRTRHLCPLRATRPPPTATHVTIEHSAVVSTATLSTATHHSPPPRFRTPRTASTATAFHRHALPTATHSPPPRTPHRHAPRTTRHAPASCVCDVLPALALRTHRGSTTTLPTR